jgi:fumarylacetoacetate (FAA) hydrolase family protein
MSHPSSVHQPELFFKSVAWRVVGRRGEVIVVRPDSTVNVPEPELAFVIGVAARRTTSRVMKAGDQRKRSRAWLGS